MNRQLELLIELQKIDSQIIELTKLLEGTPARLSDVEKPLREAEAKLSSERSRLASLEKKRKEKEGIIKEINEKIAKLKARTSEIKTNKEYQAHLKEIEAQENSIRSVEDEILGIMVDMDSISTAIKAFEKEVSEQKAKIDSLKKSLDEEVKRERQGLDALKTKRAEIANSVEPDTYALYMDLLERLGGLAVTEAKDEICQGCNMNIPPQLFVEIKKNEEIYQCPQCKRILYHIPTPPK